MGLHTLAEIRGNIEETTRESQISDLIDEFINLTIQEINDPAWAFEGTRKAGYNHLWRANRRKYTLSTVDSQEDYQLPRDVDKIGLIRTTQAKLLHVPDHLFYKWIPNPTAETTYPRYYRLWENYGVSTQISTAEKVDVVSDSASDTTQTITIVGTDANGYRLVETYTLAGLTPDTGAETFTTITQVSKSAATVGNITVDGNTSATVFVILLPEERSPRFKRVSFYPIPSTTDTSIYIEYYTRFRSLVNDSDVPNFDEKWHWVIRQGALAKVYQYQGEAKQSTFITTQAIYASGVRSMVHADLLNVDYVPYLKTSRIREAGITEISDNVYSANW